MSITCFSLVFLLLIQASTARHLNLSHKNDDGTKTQNSENIPSKDNAKLSSEQQKGSITSISTQSDQEVGGDSNKKDFAKDESKVVKSQVNLSVPVTVSWHLPDQQKRKRRKKKKQKSGYSHDPELTLDYAPPRVHPPCHN